MILAQTTVAERPPVTFDDLRIWTRENPPTLSPIVENAVQAHYNRSLLDHYGAEHLWELRGVRDDIVKARQQGFSTDILAICYEILYNTEYSQSVIVTHHPDSTSKLWARVQLFEQHLPAEKRRPLRYSNRRELVFADTGSSLFIGTAGQDNLLRSGTITNAHLSEMPSWTVDPGDVMVALLGTLPAWGNLWLESTAKGIGPHYESYCAHRDDPSTGYRAIFYGWDWTPEYAAPVPVALNTSAGLVRSNEEKFLVAHQTGGPLTNEQIIWRRRMISEYRAQGRENEFAPEFPLTAEEAFLSAITNSFLNTKYLLPLFAHMSRIEPEHAIKAHAGQLHGTLEIYKDVEEGEPYVIGADTAKGVKMGMDKVSRRDYNVMDIVNRKTEEHVASYYGREGCPPEVFARDIVAVANHFNQALVIPESNNHGVLTIHVLANEQQYPNVYFRKTNKMSPEGVLIEDQEWGWETTPGTKPVLMGYLRQKVNDAAAGQGKLLLRGPRAIKECINLGNFPNGKIAAITGHDEHPITLGLCSVVLIEMPWTDYTALKPARSSATAGGRR